MPKVGGRKPRKPWSSRNKPNTWVIPFSRNDKAAAEAVANRLGEMGMTCYVMLLDTECYVQVSTGTIPADIQTIRGVIRDVLGW